MSKESNIDLEKSNIRIQTVSAMGTPVRTVPGTVQVTGVVPGAGMGGMVSGSQQPTTIDLLQVIHVIWSYLPAHCDIIKRLPHSQVVYDCVDRHSGYPGMINPAVVDGCERDLAMQCDTVFSTASGLHETLSQYNKNSYMIPNGANYELFSQAQSKLDFVPDELADIKGPVIGFVGMLQECIDYDLITAAAKAHPEYTFVFVGKALPGVATDGLRALPNVRLCGLKPQQELPRYLSCFDVCINPFRAGALAKDVSPLKFYEYLATGKPIGTPPQPEQVLAFADAVEIAGI